MGVAIGNKIELVQLNQIIKNEQTKNVYVSKICDILPKNILQIAMPIFEGRIVPLSVEEKYSACFYTDTGLMQCNVMVTSRYKKGNLFFVEVLLLGDLTKVQRREFYRYNCLIDGKIRIVSDEEYEKEVHDPSEGPVQWKPMRILDISGGGAKIIQHDSIKKNEVVKVYFSVEILEEKYTFDLFARILESRPLQNRTDVYEQRLEFMKIQHEERDRIIKFIFESERMSRAKKVGLK